MKNFFETFKTALELTLTVFIIVMLISLESSVVAARQIHSECWHAVETSEINSEADVITLENQLNESVHKKHSAWNVSIETLTNSTARPYYLVTLNYKISIPIINVSTKGEIKAYAK